MIGLWTAMKQAIGVSSSKATSDVHRPALSLDGKDVVDEQSAKEKNASLEAPAAPAPQLVEPTMPPKVPVRVRAALNVDAAVLDYPPGAFSSEKELAKYVVEKTPIMSASDLHDRNEDLKALERGESPRDILENRGVDYDLE